MYAFELTRAKTVADAAAALALPPDLASAAAGRASSAR